MIDQLSMEVVQLKGTSRHENKNSAHYLKHINRLLSLLLSTFNVKIIYVFNIVIRMLTWRSIRSNEGNSLTGSNTLSTRFNYKILICACKAREPVKYLLITKSIKTLTHCSVQEQSTKKIRMKKIKIQEAMNYAHKYRLISKIGCHAKSRN